MALPGCASYSPGPSDSVVSAWRRQQATPAPSPHEGQQPAHTDRPQRQPNPPSPKQSIATVNGRPIPRSTMMNLLLQSHGPAVLDQLIGLEATKMAADDKGLTISQDDVDREYDRTLRQLVNPLSSVTPQSFDRATARRLLTTVLAERNVSPGEFDIIMRRNSYLRKLTKEDQVFTEAQLRTEFERLYGRRVQVRHIQLATLGEVERVKQRLADGESFGDLAARLSANEASAANQGLLKPFSENDEDVPALFRQVAFSLQPGAVSSAVRVGRWYHLIKLESVLPAEDKRFGPLRGQLEQSLRNRKAESAMFKLFEKLMTDATIEIRDPILRTAFQQRYPDRIH